jgi:GH25 family lysozyme M1 (1,4-beta-N-acetylmuramidase)
MGVDFSRYQGAPSQDVFNCFKQNGKDFAIIQIFQGSYGINPNFQGNWAKAKAAGIKYVDAYVFFCNNCGSGNTPINICTNVKRSLPSGFDGMVWLDIEGCDNCWTGSTAEKIVYVNAVAATCIAQGMKLGVYSGKGSWGNVFGSYTVDSGALKALPLWYSHYDGVPNFNDWGVIQFGGWSRPAIKQYQGTTNFCGTQVDFNSY